MITQLLMALTLGLSGNVSDGVTSVAASINSEIPAISIADISTVDQSEELTAQESLSGLTAKKCPKDPRTRDRKYCCCPGPKVNDCPTWKCSVKKPGPGDCACSI